MELAIKYGLKKVNIALIVIAFVFGFVVMNQVSTQAPLNQLLELSEQDLSLIIRELSVETNSLRNEYVDLKLRLSEYERQEADKKELLNKAAQDLQTLKIIAGVQKVEGPGVSLLVHDGERIMQSFDMLEIVHELKSAGAEAIAINGIRLDGKSTIYDDEGYLGIYSERLIPPYNIEAIGDMEILYQSLSLPGGIIDTLTSIPDVTVDVSRDAFLILPAATETQEEEKLETTEDGTE